MVNFPPAEGQPLGVKAGAVQPKSTPGEMKRKIQEKKKKKKVPEHTRRVFRPES